MPRKILFAALLISVALTATAKEAPVVREEIKRETLQDSAQFSERKQQIVEEMNPGGIYEWIRASDRAKVLAGLDRIEGLLSGHGSADELDERATVSLFNAQEEVNALLTDARSDRVICKRERVTGSNRLATVCRSLAEIEASRRSAEAYTRQQRHGGSFGRN